MGKSRAAREWRGASERRAAIARTDDQKVLIDEGRPDVGVSQWMRLVAASKCEVGGLTGVAADFEFGRTETTAVRTGDWTGAGRAINGDQ